MTNLVEPSSNERGDLLELTLRAAQLYLAHLETQSVAPVSPVAVVRRALTKALGDTGLPPEQVISDLISDTSGGLLASTSGRFFGWVIGGALPVAIAADWLTAVWDQNAVLHASSPAAAITEEVAGAWVKSLLGLPPHSSFAFVTGCQMAHVTCLAAARGALLRRRGWNVAERGLAGAPRIRILANAQHHASISRAASLLGLGQGAIEPLDTDDVGRVKTDSLHRLIGVDSPTPPLVILQAGDIATGAFDAFDELIPIAKSVGAWVHIDGAFGLWARASAKYRQLTSGCDMADSWATDGHKILNTPFDCGYAIVAHPEDHKAALSTRASYLTQALDARDQLDWNPEWSRRARGFPTYAALRFLGRAGVSELFENFCQHARALAYELGALPGAQLISEPIINQALLRFLDPRGTATEKDHDRRTDRMIERINASGEAFFTGTTWKGRRVMRISVCNFRTDSADVRRVIAAVRNSLLSMQNADRAERP